MKILITGGDGMLGGEARDYFKSHEVLCTNQAKLDLCDIGSIRKVAGEFGPDVVIHAAAYTNVERCELEPEKTFQINTLGTEQLVQAFCLDKQTVFVLISSTGIYGNSKPTEAYSEADIPSPTTVHHKSKFLAEQSVRIWAKQHLILRTGWLFGGPPGLKKNFVYNRIQEAQGKSVLFSDPSQKGNPTFVRTLLKQLDALLDAKVFGTFNAVNSGPASRLDYTSEIIRLSGLPCHVQAAGPEAFKRVAPVSKNESAVNLSLNLLGINKMGPWQNDLSEYVNELRLKMDREI